VQILNFIINYWPSILFYLSIIILIRVYKHKFEFQGIVAMLKTKFGLKTIKTVGKKYSKFLSILGIIAIVIGYIGMIFATGMIAYGAYNTFADPTAPPAVSPVLPGFPIPGTGIKLPLITGIIALFLVVAFHEFGHGVMSEAHKIKVKNTGFVLFGPIPGAFVDPDEKHLTKASKTIQNKIYAAGPFFNFILCLFLLILSGLIINPTISSMTKDGIIFGQIENNTAASEYGLKAETAYIKADNIELNKQSDLIKILKTKKPNEKITFTTEDNKNIELILGAKENDPQKPRIGVLGIFSNMNLKNDSLNAIYIVFMYISKLLTWMFMLSFGLGVANLLPLGPVDGGRMFLIASQYFFGEERGKKVWINTSKAMFIVLIILLIFAFYNPFKLL
jgi:membrane-associated protease RseP (regulator of RpoE activity)